MRSFCVIGLGCFGFSLAKSLISRKCQVMVISPDAEQVNLLADEAAYAVIGDPTNEATLRTAYLELADADYLLKTGQAGPELLEHAVISLCGKGASAA